MNNFYIASLNDDIYVYERHQQEGVDSSKTLMLYSVKNNCLKKFQTNIFDMKSKRVDNTDLFSDVLNSYYLFTINKWKLEIKMNKRSDLTYFNLWIKTSPHKEIKIKLYEDWISRGINWKRYITITLHRKHLGVLTTDIDYSDPKSTKRIRTDNCWQCKRKVRNDIDIEHVKCGWIVCSSCGVCGCKWVKRPI